MKKIISILILFVLPSILYIGCCKCDNRDYYLSFNSINSNLYTTSNILINDTLKVTDTLKASLNFNLNTVARNNTSEILKFANTANACKCALNIIGYKYKIDSIKITSSNVFNGIAAGQNLNSIFKVKYTSNYTSTVNYIPISQWIDSANGRNYEYSINLINTLIPVNKTHKFTFLLYTNGQTFQSITSKFATWQ